MYIYILQNSSWNHEHLVQSKANEADELLHAMHCLLLDSRHFTIDTAVQIEILHFGSLIFLLNLQLPFDPLMIIPAPFWRLSSNWSDQDPELSSGSAGWRGACFFSSIKSILSRELTYPPKMAFWR